MKLTIGHLYPELLNLYGDRGNIISLEQRCRWRGIEVETISFKLEDSIDFSKLDLVFLGGGSDREQLLVCKRLCQIREDFKGYVNAGGAVADICGGYQLLGHYYKLKEDTVEGLGIVDLYTQSGEGRLIGNVVLQTDLFEQPVVGFENHGGRTFIGDNKPFGKVLYGHGNNGEDGQEGVLYKNVLGTYLHGPLFPKNPQLCDYVLETALSNRYGKVQLEPLDDREEEEANHYIVQRFVQSGEH